MVSETVALAQLPIGWGKAFLVKIYPTPLRWGFAGFVVNGYAAFPDGQLEILKVDALV